MPSQQYRCRGVRGATTCPANDREAILAASRQLLEQIVAANDIQMDDVASILFTMTPDLNAEFPALAARQLGWTHIALMCAQEIERPGALPRTIRALLHWNTTRPASAIRHVYINGAESLRPDTLQEHQP